MPACRSAKQAGMLNCFEFAGNNNKIKNYKFWKDSNHAIEVFSEKVTWQKINYSSKSGCGKMCLQGKRLPV